MARDLIVSPIIQAEWSKIQSAALLAVQRTSYILLAKAQNQLRERLESLLKRCCEHLTAGASFCESIIVNRASYSTCDLLYSYTRDRLLKHNQAAAAAAAASSQKGLKARSARGLILDANQLPSDSCGADVVTWIYGIILDHAEIDPKVANSLPQNPEAARIKDLRSLVLGLRNTHITLLLPSWTEDLLFRPTFDAAQKLEDALLYTLIDLVNEKKIQKTATTTTTTTKATTTSGKRAAAATTTTSSWSLLIFLNNTERMLNIPAKVRSRLGVSMTSLDFAMNLEEYHDLIKKVEMYMRAVIGGLNSPTRSRPKAVDEFLASVFNELEGEFYMNSNKLFERYPSELRTHSAIEMVSSLNKVLVGMLKFSPKLGRALEPREQALINFITPNMSHHLLQAVSTPERSKRRDSSGAQLPLSPSPEFSSCQKNAKKQTAQNLSAIKGPRAALDIRQLPALEDQTANPSKRLRFIYWQHLPLIDLCVLLAWLNLHENQKTNYITGFKLAQNCQPDQLSPTITNQIKFYLEAIYHSIHVLLQMRVLMISHAQMVTEAPEVKVLEQSQQKNSVVDPNIDLLPFMNDPIIFPMWEAFGQFLSDMRGRAPTAYPSWLVPRRDGRLI